MTDTLPGNGGYVAAAYLVFLAILVIYLAVAAIRSARLERDLAELNRTLEERGTPAAPTPLASASES